MQKYAVKGNREIAVSNETEMEQLTKQGYDILDAQGNLIAAGKGKTVAYAQYEMLLAENKSLKAENETLKAENETLRAQLKKQTKKS